MRNNKPNSGEATLQKMDERNRATQRTKRKLPRPALLIASLLTILAILSTFAVGVEPAKIWQFGLSYQPGTIRLEAGDDSHVDINTVASTSWEFTLPTDDGGAGEVLSTDGSGNGDWVAAGSGNTGLTAGSVPFILAGGALTQSNANFFFDVTTNSNELLLGSGTAGGTLQLKEPSGSGTDVLSLICPALAAATSITPPNATATLATLALTETFTNKTLTSPVMNGATGTGGAFTGALTTSTPSAAWGLATGAGGTGTQATDKTTTVVMSPNPCKCGTITTNAAALNTLTIVSFAVTDSAIGTGDVMVVNHLSGGTVGAYTLNAACGAGTATITIRNNTVGSLSEALVISFVIIDGVTS